MKIEETDMFRLKRAARGLDEDTITSLFQLDMSALEAKFEEDLNRAPNQQQVICMLNRRFLTNL